VRQGGISNTNPKWVGAGSSKMNWGKMKKALAIPKPATFAGKGSAIDSSIIITIV
jgi:hypothetical protein